MKYFQGYFKPRNPSKYLGDSQNIIYRSSYEYRVMTYFDTNPNILKWGSEEFSIPYVSPIDRSWHRYFPDFIIQAKGKDGNTKTIVIEVKPSSQTTPPKIGQKPTRRYINEIATWGVNEAKWKAAKEYCLDRGWGFQIITEKDLNIK
jgi:hypothetical protein